MSSTPTWLLREIDALDEGALPPIHWAPLVEHAIRLGFVEPEKPHGLRLTAAGRRAIQPVGGER